jgi:peroxiredoxin Q/BCP
MHSPKFVTLRREEQHMGEILPEGSKAPDFQLPSTTGGLVGPASYAGKKKLVIAFYPKDNTSGWTKELASFTEDYSIFQELGAEILAISADSLESHRRFAEKLGGVPFPMLSDEEGDVIRLYGVSKPEGKGARRSVFVVDKEQRILLSNTEYSVSNPMHYKAILDALRMG